MCTNLDIHEMYLRLKLTCTFHQAPMNVSFGHDKELKIGRYGTSIINTWTWTKDWPKTYEGAE